MTIRNVLLCLMVLGMPMMSLAQKAAPKYKDPSVPIEQRIEDLLKRMTLDEKIQQLNQSTYGRNTNV
ncbi:MAG: hypothetical protein Q8908_12985, partial [Bacteroidota bacterium]|nr:hypothetical protein [Bacteroidota bacterium]